MKLSIIIPAYNEGKTIGEILKKVEKVQLNGVGKEIIVVDDGSIDATASVISNFQFPISNFKIIRHKRNLGKGAAVQTGIENATGDMILIQDADLEYDPKDIPRLIEPIIKNKSKVVYGTRLRTKPVLFGNKRTPLLAHFFGNKFLSLATTILYGKKITDMETGYKVFHKSALAGIKLKAKSFDFEPEITAKILRKGIEIHEIDIKTNPRGYGEGKKLVALKDGPLAMWTLIKYRFIN
ncbi:glycosyltransferase family 2 protein [Candidatus Parcubacteria bacterium]|nr:MAG: glycosyltransferase family 2 protein [Candidatus Parcubacteria bacterium]